MEQQFGAQATLIDQSVIFECTLLRPLRWVRSIVIVNVAGDTFSFSKLSYIELRYYLSVVLSKISIEYRHVSCFV